MDLPLVRAETKMARQLTLRSYDGEEDDDFTTNDLTPEERLAIQAWFGGGYQDMDDDEWERAGSSTSSTSTALAMSNRPAEPSPAIDMDRAEIEEIIHELEQEILGIDARVRKEHPDDQEAQNVAARELLRDLEREERLWTNELRKAISDERADLRAQGGRDYGLATDEQNMQMTAIMDNVLAFAQQRFADVKDEVAAEVRKGVASLHDDVGDDVYSADVRQRIYDDLVEAGVIATFEPIDTNF